MRPHKTLFYASIAIGACVITLATAGSASALTSCTMGTPCLPDDAGFVSVLPTGDFVTFTGDLATGYIGQFQNNNSGLSANGLWAQANQFAIVGNTTSTTHLGAGVEGIHNSANGASPGVYGKTNSTADQASGVLGELNATSAGSYAAGVRAHNHAVNSQGAGLWATHDGGGDGVFATSLDGIGVHALHLDNIGSQPGILGSTNSTSDMSAGVEGVADGDASSKLVAGVLGTSQNGIGTAGIGGYIGVVGYNPNAGGLAGLFSGNVYVSGTLSKAAGSFKIDHPLDPAHKYLQHSFVESPDMMNVYNGNVTTNAKGLATVRLPAYFQALNKDFRYQLTVLGHSFAQAIVWKEIARNRFTIKTDQPKTKVSWQVTGIRHDPYANAHRIQVVVPKQGASDGRYLHPELYRQPASKSVLPQVGTFADRQAKR